jgi:hypothetical protein
MPDFVVNAVRVFPPVRTANFYETILMVKVPFQAG